MSSVVAATHTQARPPSARIAAWLAWSSVALYAALAVVGIGLESAAGSQPVLPDAWIAFAVLWSAVVGALVAGSRPRNPIGWMLCALALSFGAAQFSRAYAIQAIAVAPGSLPAAEVMAWLAFWIELPGIAFIALFLPLLFPDGRLPSARWRPVAWLGATGVFVLVAGTMLAPNSYAVAGYPSIHNPLGLTEYGAAFDLLAAAIEPLLLVLIILSGVALLVRVRRADDEQRQQIKWFGYAATFVVISFILGALTPVFPALDGPRNVTAVIALTALPAAVGIAILRYRLYDIDFLINRTLVYALLTAILAGVYTGALALFERLFVATTGQGSDMAVVLTLFALATVFTPIKSTLQQKVDRHLHPTGGPRAHAPSTTDLEDLMRLADLHRHGILTDDEFAAKKKQILRI